MLILNTFVVLVGLVLVFLIWNFLHNRRQANELRNIPLEELERMVYRYENEYFQLIGENDPSVLEFRRVIEGRDIFSLNGNWNRLQSKFRELEKKAGYDGRPLIMDYYYDYELHIKELGNRMKV